MENGYSTKIVVFAFACILVSAGFAIGSSIMTDDDTSGNIEYVEQPVFSDDHQYLGGALGRSPQVTAYGDDDRWG